MEHYGIKIGEHWLMDATGIIFWTTSKEVAEQQRLISQKGEVKKFTETNTEEEYETYI